MILMNIATSFRQTHLYNLYRVLDLVVFSFANPSAKQETSLHVQCPMEITGPQGQLFSSELLDQPAPASGNHDPLPNAYDLALHPLPPEEQWRIVQTSPGKRSRHIVFENGCLKEM